MHDIVRIHTADHYRPDVPDTNTRKLPSLFLGICLVATIVILVAILVSKQRAAAARSLSLDRALELVELCTNALRSADSETVLRSMSPLALSSDERHVHVFGHTLHTYTSRICRQISDMSNMCIRDLGLHMEQRPLSSSPVMPPVTIDHDLRRVDPTTFSCITTLTWPNDLQTAFFLSVKYNGISILLRL